VSIGKVVVRRRQSAEETRRKVLDVVVQTVIDIGYYKASSNEIARRAGVTWGSIQHLFGSRDQLIWAA
jgi:AcrR family transcriptional regulator